MYCRKIRRIFRANEKELYKIVCIDIRWLFFFQKRTEPCPLMMICGGILVTTVLWSQVSLRYLDQKTSGSLIWRWGSKCCEEKFCFCMRRFRTAMQFHLSSLLDKAMDLNSDFKWSWSLNVANAHEFKMLTCCGSCTAELEFELPSSVHSKATSGHLVRGNSPGFSLFLYIYMQISGGKKATYDKAIGSGLHGSHLQSPCRRWLWTPTELGNSNSTSAN